MASKKISELTAKIPLTTDVLPVADPSTGIAGKSTTAQVLVAGFNQSSVISTGSSIAYTPVTINATGDLNNLSVGTSGIIFITSSTTIDLTGIDGVIATGKVLYIINTGIHAISVKNESVSSTDFMRIKTPVGGSLNLQVNHALLCIYDGIISRWRVYLMG